MATELLNFFVRGVPMPQPRPRGRIMYVDGKPQVHIYDQLRHYVAGSKPRIRKAWDPEHWRNRIIERTRAETMGMSQVLPIKGPVRCDVDFYFPRTQEILKAKHPAGRILYDLDKNDRDNLDKLLLDAITQAGWREIGGDLIKTPLVWEGDGRVCQGEIQRWWVARGDAPGARIVITRLVDPKPAAELFATSVGGTQ